MSSLDTLITLINQLRAVLSPLKARFCRRIDECGLPATVNPQFPPESRLHLTAHQITTPETVFWRAFSTYHVRLAGTTGAAERRRNHSQSTSSATNAPVESSSES